MRRRGCDSKFMGVAEDLVIRILLNLAVKDIVRCKCVCKSWYYLITSPSFIDQHLNSSRRRDPYLLVDERKHYCSESGILLYPPRIVLLSHETLEEVDSQAMLSDTSLAHIDLPQCSYILGCWNGILCIHLLSYGQCSGRVLLWNPATRDAKIVPPALYRCHPEKSIFYVTIKVGFGFDAKNNDYKVVAVQELRKEKYCSDNMPLHEVEVYSLGMDSWTSIPGVSVRKGVFPKERPYKGACTGRMYSWLLPSEQLVLSFDMENHVFVSTPFPCMVPREDSPSGIDNPAVIVHYGSSLAIARLAPKYFRRGPLDNEDYELWVLGEFGVPESWTKRFHFISFENRKEKPVICGIWKDYDCMYLHVAGDEKLELFESAALWPATRRCKTFPPYGALYDARSFINYVTTFNESLVPLHKLKLPTN